MYPPINLQRDLDTSEKVLGSEFGAFAKLAFDSHSAAPRFKVEGSGFRVQGLGFRKFRV